MERCVVAIPIGDAAGIGPEIVVKALRNKELYNLCKPLVVGDKKIIKEALKISGLDFSINVIDDSKDGIYEFGVIDLIDLNILNSSIEYGKVNGEYGRASFEFIKKSVELCIDNKACAIATTPINKESIKAANLEYIGHTEILAALTNTYDPLTMFQVHNLRVFFLSRHVSLTKAIEMIKYDRILDYIIRCNRALRQLGLNRPKIAVAALNPHGGEHGLFGYEEVRELEPAIKDANIMGIEVYGPIPADSVFYHALKGKYDAVLSLYHDQGHIATKTLDFEKTISLTLGLPFLRTSVDHGTAFDIAGKNIASSISMEEAIRLAALYGPKYKFQ